MPVVKAGNTDESPGGDDTNRQMPREIFGLCDLGAEVIERCSKKNRESQRVSNTAGMRGVNLPLPNSAQLYSFAGPETPRE